MNLKSFHVVFIACATALAFLFGAWALGSSSLGAARVVTAARFPPRGQRSQIARLPQFCFERLPAAELMEAADLRRLRPVLRRPATC